MQTESLRNVSILLLQKHFKASMLIIIKKKQIKNDFKKKAAWWNKLLTAKVNSFATEENAV